MEHEKLIAKVVKKWDLDNDLNLHQDVQNALVHDICYSNIPLSSKGAKKAAQQFRREAKKAFGGYQDKLISTIAELNTILKKRPKYCPNWLWRFGARIFIDISKIEKPIKPPEKDLSTE